MPPPEGVLDWVQGSLSSWQQQFQLASAGTKQSSPALVEGGLLAALAAAHPSVCPRLRTVVRLFRCAVYVWRLAFCAGEAVCGVVHQGCGFASCATWVACACHVASILVCPPPPPCLWFGPCAPCGFRWGFTCYSTPRPPPHPHLASLPLRAPSPLHCSCRSEACTEGSDERPCTDGPALAHRERDARWHAMVLRMARQGLTIQDVATLPIGVSLPLLDAIHRCRMQPSSDWPSAAFHLIGRDDCARMCESSCGEDETPGVLLYMGVCGCGCGCGCGCVSI